MFSFFNGKIVDERIGEEEAVKGEIGPQKVENRHIKQVEQRTPGVGCQITCIHDLFPRTSGQNASEGPTTQLQKEKPEQVNSGSNAIKGQVKQDDSKQVGEKVYQCLSSHQRTTGQARVAMTKA